MCLGWLTVLGAACGSGGAEAPSGAPGPPLPGERTGVFTTARPSMAIAVREHFMVRPVPVQPIEFPHNIHIQKGLQCTDFCHATVTKGPVAGLPGLKTCMMCHVALVADRPRIQQITKIYNDGQDLTWQRVYGFFPQAHVKYNHAPHIRAKIECATCHGNIKDQTVAQRNVDHTMGFCVTCHRERGAPVDCLTCHN